MSPLLRELTMIPPSLPLSLFLCTCFPASQCRAPVSSLLGLLFSLSVGLSGQRASGWDHLTLTCKRPEQRGEMRVLFCISMNQLLQESTFCLYAHHIHETDTGPNHLIHKDEHVLFKSYCKVFEQQEARPKTSRLSVNLSCFYSH